MRTLFVLLFFQVSSFAGSEPLTNACDLLGLLGGNGAQSRLDVVVDRKPVETTSEFPSRVLLWLKKKEETLVNNYRTPDGKSSESCALLAFAAAKLLLEEGVSPLVVSYRGKKITEDGSIERTALVPRIYGGRVEWGAHVVTLANGVVFDPMLGRPVPQSDYPILAFGTNEVEAKIERDTETLRKQMATWDR